MCSEAALIIIISLDCSSYTEYYLPMTNASVDAMAMVRTMKNIATARQLPEQLLRSLEKLANPAPAPGPALAAFTEARVLRLLCSVPDSCFSWVALLQVLIC